MWSITIESGDGFKYGGVIDIVNVLDMGDTYNVMGDMGEDIYMPKGGCYFDNNMIQYRGNGIEVSIHYIDQG